MRRNSVEIWREKGKFRFSVPYKKEFVDVVWEELGDEDAVYWDHYERTWVVKESAVKKFVSLMVKHLGVNEELVMREIEQPTYDSKVPLVLSDGGEEEGETDDTELEEEVE